MDSILKNVKNIHEEPLKQEEVKNVKKNKLAIGLFFILATCVINTILYLLYSLFIKPISGYMPNISWLTMLVLFISYHIFNLSIFAAFGTFKNK